MFINLHGYSTFSFLEAVGKPKDIIAKAKKLGQTAIGLTDLNVMYGAIQHYQAGEAEGIKPIVWTEVGFVLDINNISNEKNIGSLCLLAQTSQGYLTLLKIISYALQEGIAIKPKVDLNILDQHKDWILAFFGGIDSRIAKMLLNGEPLAKIQEIIQNIKNILGDDKVYLEIIAQDESQEADIAKINKAILELSQLTNTPCIISNIYAYPNKEDKTTQELAMAIKDNLKLYDPSHRVLSTQNHIMSEDEIRQIASKNGYRPEEIEEWINNTQKIADMCELKIEMGQALFPKYEAEPEIKALYEQHKENLIIQE